MLIDPTPITHYRSIFYKIEDDETFGNILGTLIAGELF